MSWWSNLPLYAQIVYGIVAVILCVYAILIVIMPNLLRQTLKGMWVLFKELFKQLNNWKGWLSFGIVWLVLSGAGLFVVGFVLKSHLLKTIAITIIVFWSSAGTPLIPITLAIALLIQKYIFKQRDINIQIYKDLIKESIKVDDSYIITAKVDKRSWLN